MAAELQIPSEKLAIVGLGVVSPLGNDVPTFTRRLFNGEHGIQTVEFPEYTHSKVKVGGVVENFGEDEWDEIFVKGKIIDGSDFDFYHVSTWGALEAVRQAISPFTVTQEVNGRMVQRLDPEIFNSDRIGLVLAGEGGGTVEEAIKTHERIKAGKKAETESIIRGLIDTPLGAIFRTWGLHGESTGVYSACASGEDAIAYARRMLFDPQSNLDGVLIVGTEWSNHYVPRSQFEVPTALSTIVDPNKTPRPFDRDGDGFVIGNASAALFLVRPDFARQHNLPIRAHHLGSGAYEEGYSMTSPLPNGEGTYMAMQNLWNKTVGGRRIEDLLKDSRFWIKAHGTGTGAAGDGNEAKGIRRSAQQHKSFTGFASLKGALGHSMSASAVVEAVAAVVSLEEGIIPPNLKCDNPMNAVEGMPLIREATPVQLEYAVTLANGFGGHQRAGLFQSAKSTI